MSNLPTWIGWVILAACPLLGPVIAFMVVLPVAVLDRRITGGREIPAVVPFEAGVTGRYTRRRPSGGRRSFPSRLLQVRWSRYRQCNSARGLLKSDPPFRLRHWSRRLSGSPNALGIYCGGDQ